MKKYCMIVKKESYFGITPLVDDDFNQDYDSLALKKVLKDFPKESRRAIILERYEIDMINEGNEIKIEPESYLNKDVILKSLSI